MQLNNNLKLKYLTGAFLITEKDIDPIGETIKIVGEVTRLRKTKKKWSESDIVFDKEILSSIYGEENLDETIANLVEKNIIVASDESYMINSELLNRVYTF